MSLYSEIIDSLNKSMAPENIFLENESAMHNVPPDSETHFKLVIVADDFIGMSKLNRHKVIYKTLSEIMKKIHALSIQAFTKDEYKSNPIILNSPDCSKKHP
jgi:BolA protein